jgi:superfamily II RNA helicase
MTELLFAKGFIKILFCTETMSVGINLPVKTCIFTDVHKFNGEINRILYAHEYTQAGGRAGRLGLDKVGHVIHLNNLFKNVDLVNYKLMMNGKPQTLKSKFKISYTLLLNLLDIGDNNLVSFAKKSMVTNDLENQMKEIHQTKTVLTHELDKIKTCTENIRTPKESILEYMDLLNKKPNTVNKKRKEVERRIQQLQEDYKYIEPDKQLFQKMDLKQKELDGFQTQYDYVEKYIDSDVESVLQLLIKQRFVERTEENELHLLFKGKMASQLREIHCLVFADLMEEKKIDSLTSTQLVSLFSCFTNISVKEETRDFFPNTEDLLLKELVTRIASMYTDYQEKETDYRIHTGMDYTLHYDLLPYVWEWCHCETVDECKLLLQKIEREKDIFLGEFVKALLKINNISCEMEKIAEMTGNIEFVSKLKEIPAMTMKYVVTNQSLYV